MFFCSPRERDDIQENRSNKRDESDKDTQRRIVSEGEEKPKKGQNSNEYPNGSIAMRISGFHRLMESGIHSRFDSLGSNRISIFINRHRHLGSIDENIAPYLT